MTIHKILWKFMEFQSGSPSIYYRISNVVHGGVWIFSGIAQWDFGFVSLKFNFLFENFSHLDLEDKDHLA